MSDTMTKIVRPRRPPGRIALPAGKQVSLQGWGRSTTAPCLAARPERMRELMRRSKRPKAARCCPRRRPRLRRPGAEQRRRRGADRAAGPHPRLRCHQRAARSRTRRHLRRPAAGFPAARLARADLAGHRFRHPWRRASPMTCTARTTTSPAASASMCRGSTCCCRMAGSCASRKRTSRRCSAPRSAAWV